MFQKQVFTQMPFISQIYKLLNVHISDKYVSIHASYELTAINSLTRSTALHNFTLLAYAPEQICLPHHTCMSHCTNVVLYMQTSYECTFEVNKEFQLYFQAITVHIPTTNMPLKCHYMPHMAIAFCVHMRQLYQYIHLV